MSELGIWGFMGQKKVLTYIALLVWMQLTSLLKKKKIELFDTSHPLRNIQIVCLLLRSMVIINKIIEVIIFMSLTSNRKKEKKKLLKNGSGTVL